MRRTLLLALALAAAASPSDRIRLRDGQRLSGSVVARGDTLLLELSSGDTLALPRAAVARIDTASSGPRRDSLTGWFPDASHTRGLALPNGFLLERGHGFLVQNELFLTQAGWGVTDHINVVGGSALPLWFVDGGSNVLLAAKGGGSLGRYLHVSVGVSGGGIDDEIAVGPFAAVTVGTPDRSATLSASRFQRLDEATGRLDWASLSGNWRVHENVALLAEAWFIGSDGDGETLLAPGVRLMSERLSGDIAFVRVPGVGFPIPWVNVAFAW